MRDHNAIFAQEAMKLIHQRRPGLDAVRTDAMHGLEILLRHGLDRDATDMRPTGRFTNRLRIVAIGFIPVDNRASQTGEPSF